jgi:hypothetical protein
MLAELVVDPTVLYIVACLIAPAVELRGAAMTAYWTHPLFIGGAVALVATVALAAWGNRAAPLSAGQRRLARWYLLNGVVIHVMLDGLVGIYQVNAPFAKQYAIIDKRFADTTTDAGAAVHVLSLVELLVMGPMCLLLYVLYQRRHAARDVTEVALCTMQFLGTVVYVGAELARKTYDSFQVDWELSFTPHYLVYFWSVMFFTALYFVLPLYFGVAAALRIVKVQTAAAAKGKKRA